MGVSTSTLGSRSSFNLPATELKQTLSVMSCLRRDANETCALLRFNAAQRTDVLDSLSVPNTRVKLDLCRWERYVVQNACTELYFCTALKSPKERRCHT